jgi:hypothetical protein
MSTDIQSRTISGTLAGDPARWRDRMVSDSVTARSDAEREIVATASAVLGSSARIQPHHNTTGTWAVDIERAQGGKVYHLYWSSQTTNNEGTYLVTITRGEALMVLLHELFHVLYTDWVERPEWCHPAHWRDFFSVLNMAEDVRIEDAGEQEVPVFATLRNVENERLLLGNEGGYPQMDSIRHVCLALYAARCAHPSIAHKFVGMLDTQERKAFEDCLPEFHWACDQRSTQGTLDNLRPVYEALLPFLPPIDGGDSGDEPGEGEQEDGDEPGEGGEGGTTEGGTMQSPQGGGSGDDESGDDESESGDDESGDDESGDDTGDGGGDGEGGESGESGDDTGEGGIQGGSGAPDELTIDDEPLRPDRQAFEWDKERTDWQRTSGDRIDELLDGSFISAQSHPTGDYERATIVASRAIRSQLNRVLQHNADGSFAGRRRRGSFDVNSARRLSLGDTRVFRTKQGPRGARDFSLVMLLDASSSVRGTCGRSIANAGYAIKRASDGIDGLDVALAAYGGYGPIAAIPFGASDAQWRTFGGMCHLVTHGSGGGTDETTAMLWARRASEKRGAEQPLIVVLTDGHPNNGTTVREQVDEARRAGILTGGIGVTRVTGHNPVVPDYHEFYTTARDLAAIPSVLAELLRTMMRAR